MHKLILITAACAMALGVSACANSSRPTTKTNSKTHKLSKTARIKACLDDVGTVEHPSPEMLRVKTGGGFREESVDAIVLKWSNARRADKEAVSGRADGLRISAFGRWTITYTPGGRAAKPSSAESLMITECVTNVAGTAIADTEPPPVRHKRATSKRSPVPSSRISSCGDIGHGIAYGDVFNVTTHDSGCSEAELYVQRFENGRGPQADVMACSEDRECTFEGYRCINRAQREKVDHRCVKATVVIHWQTVPRNP